MQADEVPRQRLRTSRLGSRISTRIVVMFLNAAGTSIYVGDGFRYMFIPWIWGVTFVERAETRVGAKRSWRQLV